MIRSRASLAMCAAAAPFLIVLTIVISVLYGAKDISPAEIAASIFHFDPNNIDHQIIVASRLPRVLGALLIGACLAVSGALMQGMTRNYLASPSIMGVSDGSVMAVTVVMIALPGISGSGLIVFSLIGSGLGAGIVFALARMLPGGMEPVKLAILGTIIGTFLGGVSAAVAAYYQISQSISFWYNARLDQLDPDLIRLALPCAAAGLALAIVLSKSITLLSMGDDIAAGLGQRTAWVKGLTILAVCLLTGISVAIAGKIAFVGLMIPHITRFLVGIDYRKVVPFSAIMGAIFLAWCDILSRFVNAPFETPIGVLTSFFGVPFFLYLIKRRGGSKHA